MENLEKVLVSLKDSRPLVKVVQDLSARLEALENVH